MKRILVAFFVLVAACSDDSGSRFDYELHQNSGVPEYGLIVRDGPLVVALAGDIDQTLVGPDIGPISQRLAREGFSVVSLDLPSHHVGDDPFALPGWRRRIENGETDIFTRFCDSVSAVLDDLHATRASVVGISRGGYVAAICAARDGRFQNIALLAPVTDLTLLEEFRGAVVDPNIYGLGQYIPILAQRSVLVRIGRNDQRVGTDAAVAFARTIGADLQLLNVEGHQVPEDGSTARWLKAHL